MIHGEDVRCPHCFGNNLQKNGKSCNSIQRWYCKSCKKYFQREYFYIAYHPGIKEKIIDMTLNGSGVRDIGRVLHINKNTVVSVLKKNSKNEPLKSRPPVI